MSLNSGTTPASGARRGISVGVFLLVIVLVAGAAIATTAAYYAYRPAAPVGSLTVTDDLGRTVTVPTHPTRVAVLSPSAMDSMVRLGLRADVVAVDCYSAAFGGLSADYSPDQVAAWGLSSSLCVQVGPTFDFEQLLNASPDLVLSSTIISVAAVETLTSTYHIPVVMLQPATLSGVEVDVSLLGEIFHVGGASDQLNGAIQAALGNATTLAQNLTDTGAPFPTVLVTYAVNPSGSPDPGYYSFGPGTFGESLIELASAASISANSTLPYPELAGAQVLASDPSFIVYGTGFGLNESSYAQGPDWSQFSAVQQGSVVAINSNYLTEPDPTMVLVGLPALLHAFHP
ncbi:MAG: ABC transporter substrate-binding protein [Thermoplasmata archaeon]